MKLMNRFIVGLSLAMLIATPNLFSQVIEEITVTARKKEENLQDVAISVNAISEDMINRLGIKDLRDVTRMDPSLTFDKGFAPDDIRIAIRGIVNNRGRPVVATVVDGVDISSETLSTAGSSSLISPRIIDVQRIEVVKGPQIALYGRTAFAGAIQYVTKDASDELETSVSLDVAQDGFHETRLTTSGPISDTMGFRFNALAWDFDGFHTNTVTGQNVGGGEGVSAALTFVIEPNDRLKIKTRLDYVNDEYDAPAQARVASNITRLLPASASRCNGGFVRDASCDGDAAVLEAAMALTPSTVWTCNPFDGSTPGCSQGLTPYASPWYPLMPAYPGGPMVPNANAVGYGSTGLQGDRVTGINYMGHFDDMYHPGYEGFMVDGNDLVIAQDPNRAHPGFNKGRDMFGSQKEGERMQINVTYSGDNVTFSSFTHIADMNVAQQYDIDKEPIRHFLNEYNVWGPTKLFSQEMRLATQNDGPFNMTAGALYWHEEMTQNNSTLSSRGFGSRCLIRVHRDYFGNILGIEDLGFAYFSGPCGYTDTDINVHADGLMAGRLASPTFTARDTQHFSMYTVLDYDFSDRFTASMELRWTDESEDMTGPMSQSVDNPGTTMDDPPTAGPSSVEICGAGGRCDAAALSALAWPVNTFVQIPAALPLGWRGYGTVPSVPTTFSKEGSYVSPKLTLRYQADDNLMIYGSFSEARKPGGFSSISVGAFGIDPNQDGNPEEISYDEEVMDVWELGMKSILLDGAMRFNSAMFFEDYTDRQVSVQKVIGTQLGNVIENAAGGQVYGFEFDVQWLLSENVTLSGGYSYLDSKYTDFKLTSTGAGEIARVGNCEITTVGGSTSCIIDRTGNVFERAPKHAANININYTDEFRNTGAMFFVELNSRYQDKRAIDFDNNVWLKDYWRFDLRTGFTKDNWEGTLYVTNLLDDDTVISGGNGPDIGYSDFRFGMVFTTCTASPFGGPQIPCMNNNGNPDASSPYAPSVTAAPAIGNQWYASKPDPRQVGLRVTYSF